VVNLTGDGRYTCGNYKGRARVVFQNKNVMCQYSEVGQQLETRNVTRGWWSWMRENRHGHESEIRKAQSDRPMTRTRRRGLGYQVRGAVETRGARASRYDDEICAAARRAGASSAKKRHLRGLGLRALSR